MKLTEEFTLSPELRKRLIINTLIDSIMLDRIRVAMDNVEKIFSSKDNWFKPAEHFNGVLNSLSLAGVNGMELDENPHFELLANIYEGHLSLNNKNITAKELASKIYYDWALALDK